MIKYCKPAIDIEDVSLSEIHKILKSEWLVNSNWVNRLEEAFAQIHKVKYAIACSSCTQGLVIALRVVGVQNMRVALPVFTWDSTLYALECNNCTPIWCDINKNTWDLDISTATNEWDTIIPVDIFGSRYIFDSMRKVDNTDPSGANIGYKIPIVWDAAHSYGLETVGHRGDAEVVSLSFTKPVTSMQGGMILTNSLEIAEGCREICKFASKMCEINAYIGMLSVWNYIKNRNQREKIVDIYRENISIPFEEQKISHSTNHSVYAILLESHDKQQRVKKSFEESGIEVKIYYKPLVDGFPIADDIFSRILALPVYNMEAWKLMKICHLINEA